MVYAKYSKGYLAGGTFFGWNWKPEFASSWEGGVKSELFDRRLRANLTLFTVKYTNLQQPIGGPILAAVFGMPELNPIGSTIANIGDERARGVEIEGSAVPVKGLTLGFGMGYTDVKLLRFIDQRFAQDLTFRPDWTANGSIQYETQPLFAEAYVSFRVDINYRSQYDAVKFNLTPLLGEKGFSPATTLINGRVVLSSIDVGPGRLEAAVWARNILNERSLAYPPSYPFLISTTYERARTFGLDLSYRY
jgi:iron complex outermembrane receptor protein